MYLQVFEGWRYLPGKREELLAQRSSERQTAGRNTRTRLLVLSSWYTAIPKRAAAGTQ